MANNDQQSSLDSHFDSLNLYSQPSSDHATSNDSYYNPQSASARFERFFNSAAPPQQQQQQQQEQPSYYSQHPPSSLQSPESTSNAGPVNDGFSQQAAHQSPFGSMPPPPMGSFGFLGNGQGASRYAKPFAQDRSSMANTWSIDPSLANGPQRGSSFASLPSPSPITPIGGFPGAFYGSSNGQGGPQRNSQPPSFMQNPPLQSNMDPLGDDDVIPTAIVVKNIPFSVKKESLLQLIEDLAIPMPYAFNYHFDQGVFRGLAFANFRSGEEADAVVAALNGFDVAGRKLRVEYKKVLQAGEKERIEKEKAIKRMRSMQIEKDRARREGDYGNVGYNGIPPMPTMLSPGAMQSTPLPPVGSAAGPYGDNIYSTTVQQPQQQAPAGTSEGHSPRPGSALTADALQSIPSSESTAETEATSAHSERSGAGPASRKEELNLNDPQALEIYSRVLLFKDDRMRDELAFSRNLSPTERRTVHLVAQKLSLYHYSVGEGEDRHVIVTKHEVSSAGNAGHHPGRVLRTQASTIGRSQRGGDGGSGMQSGYSGNSNYLNTGGSANNGRGGLRGKKSAPDMKRARDYSENGSMNGLSGGALNFGSHNGTPGSSSSSTLGHSPHNGSFNHHHSMLSRKSNGSLREASRLPPNGRHYQAGGGIGGAAGLQSLFASPFDVPPVPSLGSSSYHPSTSPNHETGSGFPRSDSPIGLPSSNGGGYLPGHASQGALRQPRGPPTPGPSTENHNFAQTRNRGSSTTSASSSQIQPPNGGGSPLKASTMWASSTPTARTKSNGFTGNTEGGSSSNGFLETQSHQALEL